jgi:hypothetical protein
VETPVLIGLYSNHANHPHDHVAVYRFPSWRPCAHTENGEIAERGFFALGALPADTSPGTRRRLAEALRGSAISARW